MHAVIFDVIFVYLVRGAALSPRRGRTGTGRKSFER